MSEPKSTTQRRSCKTASDYAGRRIVVGDQVSAVNGAGTVCGPAVRVVEMYRQGYDGTILRFDAPPETDYPNHFSRAASRCVLVSSTAGQKK